MIKQPLNKKFKPAESYAAFWNVPVPLVKRLITCDDHRFTLTCPPLVTSLQRLLLVNVFCLILPSVCVISLFIVLLLNLTPPSMNSGNVTLRMFSSLNSWKRAAVNA